MRTGWGGEAGDCRFDLPPHIGPAERRLAALAVAAWEVGGFRRVAGLDDNSVMITDVAAEPVIASIGALLGAAFGLARGMALAGRSGLPAEMRVVCDLVRMHPVPAPFEAELPGHGRGLLLVRGIALPLFDGERASGAVQIILSWREGLNRAATMRLQREIGVALRHLPSKTTRIDPFQCNSVG